GGAGGHEDGAAAGRAQVRGHHRPHRGDRPDGHVRGGDLRDQGRVKPGPPRARFRSCRKSGTRVVQRDCALPEGSWRVTCAVRNFADRPFVLMGEGGLLPMKDSLRRAGAAIAVLIAGLMVTLALSPAAQAAAAPPDAQTVLSTWKGGDPLFVAPGSSLSADQQSEIRDALKSSKNKIYLAALPDNTVTDPAGYIKQLGDAVNAAKQGGQWTVAVL